MATGGSREEIQSKPGGDGFTPPCRNEFTKLKCMRRMHFDEVTSWQC